LEESTPYTLAKLVGKILAVVLLGGFMGATLVRLAPGFGVEVCSLACLFAVGQASDEITAFLAR